MRTHGFLHTCPETPGKTSWKQWCACPYWDSDSRSCLLVKDGLFLPVEEHVVTYCLSSQYIVCMHYELLAGKDEPARKDEAVPVNRRRSIRIPCRHLFRFSEITGSDQVPTLREENAWTIDLSDHGIRFATRQQLSPETAVHFVLESGETAKPLQGTGMVVWSKPLANTPLFHAAIAFVSK